MARFFVDKSAVVGENITICGDELIHISRVLRMKQGDFLTICDGDKTDYECEISSVLKEKAVCRILSRSKNECEQDFWITLYQSVPKGEKMELVIQKSVELGICEISPFFSARTVAKSLGKTARWNKIALEAAKQCGRGIVPIVHEPCEFADTLQNLDADLAVFAYEEEKETTLKSVLRSNKKPKKIAVFIGPEGGFEKGEVEAAKKCGCIPVTLGKRILRTETASITLISNIMYEYLL